MGTLANKEYPVEIPHNAVLHQGLQCLTRKCGIKSKCVLFAETKSIFRERNIIYLEIVT